MISISVVVGISIIVRGVTRKRPRNIVSSKSIIVAKIVPTNKIHVQTSVATLNQRDSGMSLGSTVAFLLATKFINSSILALSELISSKACTFLLAGDLLVCH